MRITDAFAAIMGYLANLQQHSLLLAVVAVLALASLAFFLFFLPRSVTLKSKLSSFEKQIATLKGGKGVDPTQIDIRDPRLKHLWLQYCGTLHQQQEILNQPTGNAGRRRDDIVARCGPISRHSAVPSPVVIN